MLPFEDLIRGLGEMIGVSLHVDSHQACLIDFPNDGVQTQIDLDAQGDRILIGSELGNLGPGTYRESVFKRAMRVNSLPRIAQGYLAYSDRKDSLILFQHLMLSSLTPEKLHNYLSRFVNHARLWKESLAVNDLPRIEEAPQSGSSGMLGLS